MKSLYEVFHVSLTEPEKQEHLGSFFGVDLDPGFAITLALLYCNASPHLTTSIVSAT